MTTAPAACLWTAWIAATVLLCATAGKAASAPHKVWQVAKHCPRPAGAPKASDVVMRSLRLHPRNGKDPHDTMKALADFHVSRLAWAYIDDKAFIARVRATGRTFGGAASAPSYIKPPNDPHWFEKVVVLNLDSEPIIAPWKRAWNRTLWGCVNNPELERGYLEYLQRYIDAGAQVMQRDEPGANFLATRWGGCFCPHCIKAFRQFLADHTTSAQRRTLGIPDLDAFDYRSHLKASGAPVGDAFAGWKGGGELKRLFTEFHTQATIAFHTRTRKAIDAYAGRHVPISCNNGVHRWSPIELCFDWAFGELSYGNARPHFIHNAMQQAARRNRIQIVTMPKKGDYQNPREWHHRTRCTIATATACGGLCMVPWDVFMPRNAPRYFGTPEQYADLFGFIRANARLLDGYEDAAVAGKDLKESRYPEPPVEIIGGSGQVRAFVRARPAQPIAPAVIHLVDWSAQPKPFSLRLRKACFFGDARTSLRLLVPPPYDKAAHEKAEAEGDFAPLATDAQPHAQDEAASIRVEFPILRPWALLVLAPPRDATSTHK